MSSSRNELCWPNCVSEKSAVGQNFQLVFQLVAIALGDERALGASHLRRRDRGDREHSNNHGCSEVREQGQSHITTETETFRGTR